MEFNIEVRKKQLESLDQFISSSQDRVQSVLDCLGWKASEVLKDDGLSKCPIDLNHRIPPSSIKKHVEKCCLKTEGYDLNEKFLSEPLNNSNYSIAIDHHKKEQIFTEAGTRYSNFITGWNGQDPDPKTVDRLTTTYTSHERLALYDYAIANTSTPVRLPEFNISIVEPKTDKPFTYEEQLALERNAKRRRIKYKSTHTSKKNYIEVIKEVIDKQMELYKEWVEEKEISERPEDHDDVDSKVSVETCVKQNEEVDYPNEKMLEYNPDRSVGSRNSTHSGSSRSTSRREQNHKYSHRRYKHERSFRRDNGRRSYDKHEHHYKSHDRRLHRYNHHCEKFDKYREKERLGKYSHA